MPASRLRVRPLDRVGEFVPSWTAGSRLSKSVFLLLFAAAAGLLVGVGHLFWTAGAIGLVIAVIVAWQWPVFAIAVELAVFGGYQLFYEVPGFNPYALQFGGGIGVELLILASMAAAATLRLVSTGGRKRLGILVLPVVCFALLLLVEALRNVPAVGLSAFGELRSRYLVLVLPFFAVTCLRSPREIRQTLKVFVFFTVPLAIVAAPVIFYLNDWRFGANGRLYDAHSSLGLLTGIVALWALRSWFRWRKPALYAVTVLAAVEIIWDAHRSVWVAALLAIAVLWLTRGGIVANVRRLAVVVVAVLAAALLEVFTPLDVLQKLISRGGAVIAVQDTTLWRVVVQKASLGIYAQSPIAGRGLGFYWNTYVPELGRVINVFPHSTYVMMLVHFGTIGALLLLWLGVSTFRVLLRPLRAARAAGTGEGSATEVARLGLAVLVAMLGYCFAYGFDAYPLLLVGLCAAGALCLPHRVRAGEASTVEPDRPTPDERVPRTRDSTTAATRGEIRRRPSRKRAAERRRLTELLVWSNPEDDIPERPLGFDPAELEWSAEEPPEPEGGAPVPLTWSEDEGP